MFATLMCALCLSVGGVDRSPDADVTHTASAIEAPVRVAATSRGGGGGGNNGGKATSRGGGGGGNNGGSIV